MFQNKFMILNNKQKIKCVQMKGFIFILAVILVGCSNQQNKLLSTIPELSGNNNSVKNLKKNNGLFFKGENIDIVEAPQSNLEELPFKTKKNVFCFEI